MFGKRITLFTVFNFAVRIDLSWLVIFALIVWTLSAGVFPGSVPGLRTWLYVIMAVAAAIGLFLSVVTHELAHSLVARRSGLPMNGITLFLLGGVAEMSDEPPSAKAEFWMAIAGPATSLVITGIFLGLSSFGRSLGWSHPVTAVLRWIGYINGILFIFNMIPGYPLDGGRVLRAILWQRKGDLRAATHRASQVGSLFGFVLIGLGIVNLLLLNPLGGLWWILIGFFIRSMAKQSYEQVLIRSTLSGERVSRFMSRSPVTVAPEMTIDDFVENVVYRHHFKLYPVVEGGRLAGCITTREVRELPREEWSRRTIGELAQACSVENTIGPDTDAAKALGQMSRSRISRLIVAEGTQLQGVLSLKDLMQFLSTKLDLEKDGRRDKNLPR
jgi:Zn-dependent protease/CBS domain-containing protein